LFKSLLGGIVIRFFKAALLVVCSAWTITAGPITPAVEYTSVTNLSDGRAFTLGYSFTTSVDLNINALGFWDDGQGTDHQVGIWDSLGNLLLSTTVLGTDTISGHYRWHDVSYALTAGSYVIGGEYTGGEFPADAQGVTTISGYTWGSDLQIDGAGLIFPTTDTSGSYGQNGILIPNFSVDSTEAPEPLSIGLTGFGLLAFAIRRKLASRAR
jgi:hypothetical protein